MVLEENVFFFSALDRGAQDNFAQKSDKGIGVEYSQKSKAYRVFPKEIQTLIESLLDDFDKIPPIYDNIIEEEIEVSPIDLQDTFINVTEQ